MAITRSSTRSAPQRGCLSASVIAAILGGMTALFGYRYLGEPQVLIFQDAEGSWERIEIVRRKDVATRTTERQRETMQRVVPGL